MSLLLLRNDICSRWSSIHSRDVTQLCRRRHRPAHLYLIATASSSYCRPGVSRNRSVETPFTVSAPVSSSAYMDYRDCLAESVSKGERLRRSISAMSLFRKKHWRVTAAMLDIVIDQLDNADSISEYDAEFLLRCCGRLTPAAPVQRKMKYLTAVWDSLPRLGLRYDLHMYTRLQQILLQNHDKFSPDEFLDRVRNAGYEPNAFLYLGSIIRCAMDQKPDFERIKFYLDEMDKCNLDWFTKRKVHYTLINAYSAAGDVNQVRKLMEESKTDTTTKNNVEYLRQCYFSIVTAHINRGDMKTVFKELNEARKLGAILSDFHLIYLTRLFASVGRQDYVPRLLSYMRKGQTWIYHTMSMVLALVADGHYVTALTILQRTASSMAANPHPYAGLGLTEQSTTDDTDEAMPPSAENIYHFLLDLFYLKLPPAQIMALCRRLADCGYADNIFQLVAVAAFDVNHDDVSQLVNDEQLSSLPVQSRDPAKPTDVNKDQPFQTMQPVSVHYQAALRFRASLGDMDSVMRLLSRISASHGFSYPPIHILSRDIIGYYYSTNLKLSTIFNVFGKVCTRRSLLTAAICVCLRNGNEEKARDFLSSYPQQPLSSRSKELTFSLAEYYRKTYDASLVVDILTRIENTLTDDNSANEVETCARWIHTKLRQIISSNELTRFVDALSKAGIEIRLAS